MKRSAPDKSDDYLHTPCDNQGIPYRVRLGNKEIKMCLISGKRRLTWHDVPRYGYAVASVDQPDLIMVRDVTNYIMCFIRYDVNIQWSDDKDVWMYTYLLYYVYRDSPSRAIAAKETPYDLLDYESRSAYCTRHHSHRDTRHSLAWTSPSLDITIYADLRRDDYMARLEKIFLLSQDEALPFLVRDVVTRHIIPSVIC